MATVLMGGGGGQLSPTEFGKLCVPPKKSWLRPWFFQISISLSLKLKGKFS